MVKIVSSFFILFTIFTIFISVGITPSFDTDALNPSFSEEGNFNVVSPAYSLLIVLMELIDDPHHPTHTKQHFESLFFSNGPNTVNQYYQNNSYNEISLEGSILGWFPTEKTLEYYGAGERIPPNQDSKPHDLVKEAQKIAIDRGENPENYDLFVVIHSGDGQEYSGNSNDIWSHKGSSPVEYIMNHEYIDYVSPSHEFGHALSFPDLYDLNLDNNFVGPFGLMDNGKGHLSIWNKYYSHISRPDSPQFLSNVHRSQITNFSEDIFITINPIALTNPEGVMWVEIDWDSSGFTNSEYGQGWTMTVREDIDYDKFLPKHGVIIAKTKVGPRSSNQIQVSSNVYPPWNVIDAHSETRENKNDAPFSLDEGDISTFQSGEGWAVQLIEKYENLSYRVRITNESNIPQVMMLSPNESISDTYELRVIATTNSSSIISSVEVSIDNSPWLPCTPVESSEVAFSHKWDTTLEREGTHLIRTRAIDNTTLPYVGYSPFISVEVDNTNGTILVVDDDLGRSSEFKLLSALDELNFQGKYEVKRTASLSEAEITAEELMKYEYVIWIGNPDIIPLSNSHINYNEFLELKKFLTTLSNEENQSRIIFMGSYNIFDFSNQGDSIHNEIAEIFRARSPKNFRSPVSLLTGKDFLKTLPSFPLGRVDTIRANRSSDGEVVTLLSGIVPVLEDSNSEFPEFNTKGYYVITEKYKLLNFLFQPEMVPSTILPELINLSLNFLQQPVNVTTGIPTSISQDKTSSIVGIDPFFNCVIILIIAFHFKVYVKFRE
ncbi:MAG: immune inhibitor A domain-containing protein [Candidatus Hodarchaeales archaeon]